MKNRERFSVNLVNFAQFLVKNFKNNTAVIYMSRVKGALLGIESLYKLLSRSKSYFRQLRSALRLFKAFTGEQTNVDLAEGKIVIRCTHLWKIGKRIVAKTKGRVLAFYMGELEGSFQTPKEAQLNIFARIGRSTRNSLNIGQISTGVYILCKA